jgi:hypothetical protein
MDSARAAIGVSSQVVDAVGRSLALAPASCRNPLSAESTTREAEESGGLYVWPNSLWNRPVLFYLVVLACSFGLVLLMAFVGIYRGAAVA